MSKQLENEDIKIKIKSAEEDDCVGPSSQTTDLTGTPASANDDVHKTKPDSFPDLGERYEIIELLGTGGIGSVFKTIDRQTNCEFAIKLLRPELLEKQDKLKRFEKEMAALTRLSHPNVVAVYDHGRTTGSEPFIVMENVVGEALSNVLASHKSVSNDEAVSLFLQLCDGLAHAHSLGVIHRDLKPSNIILTGGDQSCRSVKLVDFGIARVVDSSTGKTTNFTKPGEVFGTPHYMSPEQCQGNLVDARTDIYSLGCIMYEVLNGTRPFEGANPITLAVKHISEKPSTFKGKSTEKEPLRSLEAIVMRCLEKQTDARYQSMEELKKDLIKVSKSKKVKSAAERNRVATAVDHMEAISVLLLMAITVFFMSETVNKELPSHFPANYLNNTILFFIIALPALLTSIVSVWINYKAVRRSNAKQSCLDHLIHACNVCLTVLFALLLALLTVSGIDVSTGATGMLAAIIAALFLMFNGLFWTCTIGALSLRDKIISITGNAHRISWRRALLQHTISTTIGVLILIILAFCTDGRLSVVPA